ncbi:poly-gamma-glutamate hydrolase family protein [Streptomyces scopuliridis]|uniref:poly-gamma-glutamate hydrolase family protein n=1 Tax=Streptomyces scopuliridis TaxID=452529 RepID=UPI0036C5A463
MADVYPNWAALAAVEVEGTDYRIDVRRTPSRVSHIAIHGGSIEPGSSEVANDVASLTGQQYYNMEALPGEAPAARLHVTSTHFDEPRCLTVQSAVMRTVSYHGLSGTDAVTHMGGRDEDLLRRIGLALEGAGFLVEWGTADEVNGDSPANIANRNRSGAGVQLEMTRGLRNSFFPGGQAGDAAARNSGERTEAFYRYTQAIASVTRPLDTTAPEGGGGLDWGPQALNAEPALYRVQFADLLTDKLIDELPVTGLTFDDYIGKSGSLSGTVLIPDVETATRARQALTPGRTAVWVLRGPEVWWGGILWTSTPSTDGRSVPSRDIQAGSFDTYFDHRIVFADLTAAQKDQFAVARSVVEYTRGLDNGDIGITTDETQTSGILIDHRVSRYDQLRVRDVLDALANTENGFEWRVRAYIEGATGTRIKRLELGHPKIIGGVSDVMLTYPGNIVSYSLPKDATGLANVWQARGGSKNGNPAIDSTPSLSALMASVREMDAGWPRLDGSSDYADTSVETVLDSLARADLERARTPVEIPSVSVRLDGEMTPALIGSTVRLRVRDLLFPEGLDARYRVVGMQVAPLDRTGAEGAELYLEAM